jgi:hypothetical protein
VIEGWWGPGTKQTNSPTTLQLVKHVGLVVPSVAGSWVGDGVGGPRRASVIGSVQ